jgi:hypothetical protein
VALDPTTAGLDLVDLIQAQVVVASEADLQEVEVDSDLAAAEAAVSDLVVDNFQLNKLFKK